MADPTPPPDDPLATIGDVATLGRLAGALGDRRVEAAANGAGQHRPMDLGRMNRGLVRSVGDVAKQYVSFAVEPGARFRSGLPWVDAVMRGGTAPGEVTCLLAPSFTGKTTVFANVAAFNATTPLLFFSIEMPEIMVAARLFSIVFGEEYKTIEERLRRGDKRLRYMIEGELGDALPSLGLVGQGGITVEGMGRALDEYEQGFGQRPEAIMIDYLDLIGGGTEGVENAKRKFNDLRELAKERELAVLVAHQVVGEVLDKRHGGPLHFNDGRYAGGTEADHVIGLFRRVNDKEVKENPKEYAYERWTIHAQVLKTRSNEAQPEPHEMGWNPFTLRVTEDYDHDAREYWEPRPTPRERSISYLATQASLPVGDEDND